MGSKINGAGSILVIEDDESTRALMEELLADEGYDVRCAQDGGGALDLISERPPAVILFDLGLPDMGGEQFVAAYRSRADADAALIAVSGARDLGDAAARMGADDYLTKPFDIDRLVAAVRQVATAAAS